MFFFYIFLSLNWAFFFFFQARLMDVVFILLETLNTLLDTLGVVVMEGATCILPRFSWGSIVLEILQWRCLHQKTHQNLKFFTILW